MEFHDVGKRHPALMVKEIEEENDGNRRRAVELAEATVGRPLLHELGADEYVEALADHGRGRLELPLGYLMR